MDFGYKPGGTGSIGDLVFDDKGNDGTFNGADVGIPNVTVNLYEDTNGNGVIDAGDALIATDGTDGSGIYGFTGLAEGLSYIVDVDQADPDIAHLLRRRRYRCNPPPTRSRCQSLTGAYTAADFGFYKVVPGSIGDQVWFDADGDGVVDAGEAGLANVTVQALPGHQRQRRRGYGRAAAGARRPPTPTASTASTTCRPATYVVDVDENDPDVPGLAVAYRATPSP